MTAGPTCARWLEAISAIVDGEDPGIDVRLVAAHVAGCGSCRAFEAFAANERRHQLVREATPMPDFAPQVSKWAAVLDRASRWTVVRGLLAVVALEIIAFSLPALVLGDEHDTSTHAAHHLGAFTMAYGVGLLVVVARPARARTMLPVAAMLAGALVITAVVDLVEGRVPLLGETQHLPEVLSVAFVWLLAVPAPRRRGQPRRRPGPATLAVVPDDPGHAAERDIG